MVVRAVTNDTTHCYIFHQHQMQRVSQRSQEEPAKHTPIISSNVQESEHSQVC